METLLSFSRPLANKMLRTLIFLQEKNIGNTKAFSCTIGSVQHEHAAKEEATLPYVALESVFATYTVDAKENKRW